MNQSTLTTQKSYTAQKIVCWLLLLGLFLVLTRIGVRHYFREEAVKPGTFPVSVGRVFALWALALMLLQPILAIRLRFLDRIFGLDRLLLGHRLAGIAALTLASLHPMLMYVSGLKKLGPMDSGQWPEAIGAFSICGLWFLVVSSLWRKFLAITYDQWLKLHKFMAPVVVLALTHMFIIESAMRKGWILGFWVVILTLWGSILLTEKLLFRPRRALNEAFVVASAGAAAENIWRIDLKPASDQNIFKFNPGQFAFLSFNNAEPGPEEHPFTIASAPAQTGALQFLIKAAGDWTAQLNSVRAGDKVRVSGPFGVFSPWRHQTSRLILIAGGIGITPMLSILRQLREEKSSLAVKLIWTFQRSVGAPCLDEIAGMRQAIPAFEFVKIVTREASGDAAACARFDKQALAKLIPEYQPGSLILLCGPTQMMRETRSGLAAIGYPNSAILSEEFSF